MRLVKAILGSLFVILAILVSSLKIKNHEEIDKRLRECSVFISEGETASLSPNALAWIVRAFVYGVIAVLVWLVSRSKD